MMLIHEFYVLQLRIEMNVYDPRSFLALLKNSPSHTNWGGRLTQRPKTVPFTSVIKHDFSFTGSQLESSLSPVIPYDH